jgi:acyl CoA:acetate/3-ketoacid CoA transferase beta subunit
MRGRGIVMSKTEKMDFTPKPKDVEVISKEEEKEVIPVTRDGLNKIVKNKPTMDKIISNLAVLKIKKKKIKLELNPK